MHCKLFPENLKIVLRTGYIHFICNNKLRQFRKLVTVAHQLTANLAIILKRITPFRTGNIEHMHEHPCALYVTQKIMPQSCAIRCAFDKTGNISNNK